MIWQLDDDHDYKKNFKHVDYKHNDPKNKIHQRPRPNFATFQMPHSMEDFQQLMGKFQFFLYRLTNPMSQDSINAYFGP